MSKSLEERPMAVHGISGVLHYLRSLVGVDRADSLSDAALLRRFAQQHDEAALVRFSATWLLL